MIPILTLIPNCFFDAPITLTSSQANLEDDRKKRSQDEAEKMDLKCAKMDPEKSDSEASATGEQDDAGKGRCSSVDEVRSWAALPTLVCPPVRRPCTHLLVSSWVYRSSMQNP